MIKIRDGVVANRPVYLAIGIDCESAKQVLGLLVGPLQAASRRGSGRHHNDPDRLEIVLLWIGEKKPRHRATSIALLVLLNWYY
jgi:Transposase, Mutator family